MPIHVQKRQWLISRNKKKKIGLNKDLEPAKGGGREIEPLLCVGTQARTIIKKFLCQFHDNKDLITLSYFNLISYNVK